MIRVTYPGMVLIISHDAVCVRSRGNCSKKGERAFSRYADDRHGCATCARQIQMGQGQVVVDYIDTGADHETRKLPAIVIDVEDDHFTFGAAREQPTACHIERNPARAITAV